MRTDILDLHRFYETPLGAAAQRYIGARLLEAWGPPTGLRLAGFGYAGPYLDLFPQAERLLLLAPESQGAMRWPLGAASCVALAEENRWPLPDAAIDRLLVVHGLEEAGDPRLLMREAWRVLAPQGRLVVVAAHRRGLWSIVETTPFAAGRPYLRGQLLRLLESAMFRPQTWSGALYFPPFGARFLLRAAAAWERAGAFAWPALSGVLMVVAAKDLYAPIGLVRKARAPSLRPIAAPSATASLEGAPGRGL